MQVVNLGSDPEDIGEGLGKGVGKGSVDEGSVIKQVNPVGNWVSVWGNLETRVGKRLELVPTKMGQRWDVLCAVLIVPWLRTALWSMLILHCCWPTVDELHGHLKSLGKKVQFLEGGRFEGVWSGCLQQLLQLAAVIQSLSCVRLFETPWNCSMPGFPVLCYLPEFAQTSVH